MNQYFSFSRFGRLLRRHTAEHLRGYLMQAAVLAGGLVVVLGGITYLNGGRPLEPGFQRILYVFFLLAAGGVFTSAVFAGLGDKRQAAPALLLPAAHLEKFLVAWGYSLPVFLVAYSLVFLGVDALVLQLAPAPGPRPLLNLLADPNTLPVAVFSYALLHSAALWGAVYFERWHVVKTALAVFGLLGLLAVVNFQILKRLVPGVEVALPFGGVMAESGGHGFELRVPATAPVMLWLTALPLLLAALLWLGAYVRLTEKQL